MKLGLSFIAFITLSVSALNAGIIADLQRDLQKAVNSAKAGDIFDYNGWSARQGNKALVFDSQLYESNVSGFKSIAESHPLDITLDLGHISVDGVFDGELAQAKEIGLHPSFRPGAASDLIIRWTAERDYRRLILKLKFRRASSKGDVGLAIRFNNRAFDFDDNSISSEPVSEIQTYKEVKAGDFIEIVIYNGKDKRGAGDQSFGNFTLIGY